MTRDVAALSARTFDLLVIGGGIYGLTIAADAAQRGLSVAVVERDDFGSGSTFNHLRTIHGGLRYLQTLDVVRARESIRERRTLAHIAPRFVRPLPFVLPLTARWFRGPAMMSAGLRLDALIAGDRNHQLPASHHLPQGRVVAADAARARFPWLRDRPMLAAAVWSDYVLTESDRLTFAWVIAAASHGATVVNHMAATQLLVDGRRVVGARVHDATTGRSHEIAARLTVNATGGDVDGLLAAEATATGTPMLRAMNLVTKLPGGDAAIGAQTPSGRALFMVPWRGRALFGTWESAGVCAPSERQPGERDIAAFVEQVAAAYPDRGLRRDDVTLVHRGIVPAIRRPDGGVALDGRQHLHDHGSGPAPIGGLLSVVGTKFTTARAVAERATDRILAKLGETPVPCRTASLPLPGVTAAAAAAAAVPSPIDDWPADVRDHLATVFGDAAGVIAAVAGERPGLGDRLSPDSPVVAAQIAWAARHEMAVTLADVVIRRTPLGALGCPSREVLNRAAAVMADELGWTPARTEVEIAAVPQFYAPAGSSVTAPETR